MKPVIKTSFFLFLCLLLIARASVGFTALISEHSKYSFMKMDCEENEGEEQESEKECKDTFEKDTDFFHNTSSLLLADRVILRFYKTSENSKPQVYLSCPFLPPELIIS